jgi:hypothetical protein
MTSYIGQFGRGNRVKQTGTFTTGGDYSLSTGGIPSGYQGISDAFAVGDRFPCWITATGDDKAVYGLASYAGPTGGVLTINFTWSESYGAALTTGDGIVATIGPMAEGPAFNGVIARNVFTVPNTTGGTSTTGWSTIYDPHGVWSATGQTFTVPEWAGAARVSMNAAWDNATGGTVRSIYSVRCGGSSDKSTIAPSEVVQQFVSPVFKAQDIGINFFLEQDSATGQNATVEVSIEFWPGYTTP